MKPNLLLRGAHFLLLILICCSAKVYAQAPSISSFTPSSGPVGTLVTINGSNLGNGQASISGTAAITVSAAPTKLVIMVMPGTATSTVSVNNGKGTQISTSKFTVTPTLYPSVQQGDKLVGTGAIGAAAQGGAVTISADGNTAAIGGNADNKQAGCAWVFIRAGTTWKQEAKLFPNDAIFSSANQLVFGTSVSLSADGNTLLVGGIEDSQQFGGVGATWVFVRENGNWKQQGKKLIGTGYTGSSLQGQDVALSADGNTAVTYGTGDDFFRGAFWVFTRTGETWTQQGPKYVPSGLSDVKQFGGGGFHSAIAVSADGNTVLTSGYVNLNVSSQCVSVVFTRKNGIWTEQSGRLQVSTGLQAQSVALSADATTALISAQQDDGQKGGAWVFVKNGNSWVQQGGKLIGPGADAESFQGTTLALSADGNTAIMGQYGSGKHSRGGIWVFTRKGSVWSLQEDQLVGYDTGEYSFSGAAVALSADGKTSINAGFADNNFIGAAWIFASAPLALPTAITLPATELSFSGATLNGTVADNGSQTDVIMEYGTDAGLNNATNAQLSTGTSPINAGTGTVSFTSVLTNLKPATTYYFRITGINAGGTASGNILSFVTPARPAGPPIAKTLPATAINLTTATLNGSADDYGSQTNVSFQFGTSPSLMGVTVVAVTTGINPMPANTGLVNFTSDVVALIPKTTYYFRIVAESGNGLSMGNILSFVAQPTSTGANGLVIPNTFTPNNDGVNDTWDLSSLTLSSNSVVNIYNRYGMLIYASVGYSTPWDGTYKRMNVPMGTYYYVIDFKNGTTPIAGPITIIR